MVFEFFEKVAFKIAKKDLMKLEIHKLEYQKSDKLLLISETVVNFHKFHLKVLQCYFRLNKTPLLLQPIEIGN